MKLIIGLTGLIGSGKSAVADQFIKLGIDVIDTDKIALDLTSSDSIAITKIQQQFGSQYANAKHGLQRDLMRKLVFNDNIAKFKLEKILHPLIFQEVKPRITTSTSPYVIVMVPLLFKSLHYMSLIHRSIFVDCNLRYLISRVIQRNNFTQQQVESILHNQIDRKIQLSLCDDIISNNGSFAELYNRVLELDKKYRDLSKILA